MESKNLLQRGQSLNMRGRVFLNPDGTKFGVLESALVNFFGLGHYHCYYPSGIGKGVSCRWLPSPNKIKIDTLNAVQLISSNFGSHLIRKNWKDSFLVLILNGLSLGQAIIEKASSVSIDFVL